MTEHTPITEENGPATPGPLLQQKRLAAGLTEEEVARRLNLRIQVIKDLEADEFAKLATSTYVKGYLKAYARLLQLPEKQVLDAYSRAGGAEPSVARMQSFSQRTQKEAYHSRLMWLTYAIAAVVVVMFVIWWLQADQAQERDDSAAESPAAETPLATDSRPAPGEFGEPLPPSADQPIVTEQIVPPDTVQPPSELPLDSEPMPQVVQPETLPEVAADVPQAQTDSNDSGAEGTVANAPATEATNRAATTAASEREIVMTFNGDCWVKVTDANGEVLLSGLRQGGREARVTGEPPFRLIIGAPQVVELSYRGESVDLSQYQPGKPARFQLPAQR